MAGISLLLVDDEDQARSLLAGYLSQHGFNVTEAGDGVAALEAYRESFSPVALIDLKMPGMGGMELLRELRALNPFVQVIVLTAFGSVESAVEAMRAGAVDYLTKPVEELDELRFKLLRAAETNALIRDQVAGAVERADSMPHLELLGDSPPMLTVRNLITKAAPTDSTVLVTGPSGSGKELVARSLHAGSPRATGRLVAINCGAFPESLLEAELFGHEKGAFTGADRQKPGRIELAHEGTLFLDEIAEMPPTMQVKLLRVLEERRIERVGGTESIPIDFRLIAATNRDLEKSIANGAFREDLYYRLNVVRIELPPLADRGGDILLLAQVFLARHAQRLGKSIDRIDPGAAALLRGYQWPGNVRELDNLVERAVVLATGTTLTRDEFTGIGEGPSDQATGVGRALVDVEREHIVRVLAAHGGNITAAADVLGIHRNTLRTKIRDYGL